MKKLLPLFVFLLCSTLAMAYQVTVFGYVKNSDNSPVANLPVLVELVVGNVITQSKTVLTNSNGKYIAQFNVDDNVQEANAHISIIDCNGLKKEQSASLSKSHPQTERHFLFCEAGCEIAAEIAEIINNNGHVLLKGIAQNGVAPYTYLWSNGSTSQTIETDPGKNYCVTITDHDGCTGKACYEPGQGNDCAVEIHSVPVDNTGKKFKLLATPKGDGPFTYLWTTGSTDHYIIVEESGKYCVTITSASGCVATACIEVHVGGQTDCAAFISVVYDGGKAKLTASGKGKEPFTYHWTNGSNDQSILVEKAGEYCVIITDANGCTAKACVKIHLDKPCSVHIKAFHDGGKVKLTAFPTGVAPFTYKWSNGSTDQSIVVDHPGEYCVVIVDATGCEAKTCYTVKFDKPKECSVKIQVIPSNTPNGPVHLLAIPQGQGPFTFKWSTGSHNSSIVVEKPGEYCVVIVDATGCEAKVCIHIKGDAPGDCSVHIKLKYSKSKEAYLLQASAKGKAPFSYAWSTGSTDQSITVDEPGLYCVTITDQTGCHAVTCLEIEEEGEFTGGNPDGKEFQILKSFPMPATSEINFQIDMKVESALKFEILNMTGAVLQVHNLAPLSVGEHLINLPINQLGSGLYYMKIQSEKDNTLYKFIKV